MSELFKKTIEHLPQILVKNANAMMLRMAAGMQQAIRADSGLENATFCMLVLKTASSTLAVEFERAMAESMAALRRDTGKVQFSISGFSLSIVPLEPVASTAKADFQPSTAAFDKLCAKAAALGVRGLGMFNKDVMLECVVEAFGKSRVEAPDVATMLPYLRRALNDELLRLYAKLDAL